MEIWGNYDTKTNQWVLTSKKLNLVFPEFCFFCREACPNPTAFCYIIAGQTNKQTNGRVLFWLLILHGLPNFFFRSCATSIHGNFRPTGRPIRQQARHGRISSGRIHFCGNGIIVMWLHTMLSLSVFINPCHESPSLSLPNLPSLTPPSMKPRHLIL